MTWLASHPKHGKIEHHVGLNCRPRTNRSSRFVVDQVPSQDYMNIPIVYRIRPVGFFRRGNPPTSNWLTHITVALLGGVIVAILAACQPRIIQVDKPVTRIVEVPVQVVVERPVEVAVKHIVEKTVEIVVTSVVERPVEIVVTRVVEKPVEIVVTRVVEKPVEKIVTRVVDKPVERTVTRLVERPTAIAVTHAAKESAEEPLTRSDAESEPSPTRLPVNAASARTNVALLGSAFASDGRDSAQMAIDGDVDSLWNSANYAVQWFMINLNSFYQVDTVELVVAQAPASETTHEVWLGDISGTLERYYVFKNVHTADGQTLDLRIEPGEIIDRVLIRTVSSPSWVAWREVRVFGMPPSPENIEGARATSLDEQRVEWPEINLTGGLEFPVHITHAGDGTGRLFVIEQRGRIRVIKNGKLAETPFLDITDRVSCCGERGLLSVVFPPNYVDKNYFYVNYTSSDRGPKDSRLGDTVIARFRITSDADIADPDSEEVVLVIEQPAAIHNGGQMVFGPNDGHLYIGTGDGGPADDPDNRGQDPTTLLGKILRIDVESGVSPYAIPITNPFHQTDGYRREIWALGLRNPWGLSFDRDTADLYIADVGQDDYEEINFQSATSTGGENYGWSIMEGWHCFGTQACDPAGLTPPVAEYNRHLGCAVIGGHVYRGSRYPRMKGVYLYADFCTGQIWGLRLHAEVWRSTLLFDAPFQISAIGEDEDGNLYVAEYNRYGSIWILADKSVDATATPPSVSDSSHPSDPW